MWDEEKFFKDFVEEADKVKPDADFVEKMVSLVQEEENAKVTPFRSVKKWTPAIAAACLICIVGIGTFMQTGHKSQDTEMNPISQMADKEQGNTEFSSFSPENTENALQMVEEMLEKDVLILDAEGVEISPEVREELLDAVSNAVLAENSENKEVIASYTMKSEEEILLEVLEDNFLSVKVGDKNKAYYEVH